MMKNKAGEYTAQAIIGLILLLIAAVTLFPFLNTLAISFNAGYDTARGGIYIWPRVFTLENFKVIFAFPNLYSSFLITILRTAIGSFVSLLVTGMFAYGLSKPNLKGKNFYMAMSILTMYFSGGLIPYYLLIRGMALTDNFLVYIIPYAVGVYNMIIMRTYFKSLPEAVEESAKIDGAGLFTIFFKIVTPLSGPIIAVMLLFNAVFQWNSWFDANIFITKQELRPLQMILIRIIASSRADEAIANAGAGASVLDAQKIISVRSITACTIIVTVVPIIIIYPFLQRYFAKGIMIGAVKG